MNPKVRKLDKMAVGPCVSQNCFTNCTREFFHVLAQSYSSFEFVIVRVVVPLGFCLLEVCVRHRSLFFPPCAKIIVTSLVCYRDLLHISVVLSVLWNMIGSLCGVTLVYVCLLGASA